VRTATPPAKAGRASDTRARLIATPIILLVIAGVLALQDATGSTVGTHLVLAAFAAVGGAEMALLFRRAGRPARIVEAAVWCAAFSLVGLIPGVDRTPGFLMLGRVAVLLGVVLWMLAVHALDTRAEAVDEIACRVVPILYVGFLFSFMADLVFDWRVLIWVVLTAKASDMAGWAIGKPFGRHKMIPSVSPGKSWEGTIAGLLASMLTATFLPMLLGLFGGETQPWFRLPLFGLVLGAVSIAAGITWSGWKRRLHAKDSSPLIPHMGGVTDMLDSLLFAAPVAAAFFWVQILARWA